MGKTSRDRPDERWPERDEEDLERCTEEEEEEEEEERARDLKNKSQIHSTMLIQTKYFFQKGQHLFAIPS